MLLNITKRKLEPDVNVVELAGRLTLGRDCQDVEWTLDDLMRQGARKVVFDLSRLNHMDSTGVGIIVMCSGKLKKAGGEFRLSGPQGLVLELLQQTRVDSILEFFPSAEEAARGW